jgi:hypothetical protein
MYGKKAQLGTGREDDSHGQEVMGIRKPFDTHKLE